LYFPFFLISIYFKVLSSLTAFLPNSCIEFNSRYINIANWQAVHLYVQNAFLACWCTPQSPKTMKINFHGATPIGFVMLMYFQHFINSSLLPFLIYEIIFSNFLCRFGISNMLEKFCFYQFFQHPGQDRKRISLYLMAISW